jgi:hypothetical protein
VKLISKKIWGSVLGVIVVVGGFIAYSHHRANQVVDMPIGKAAKSLAAISISESDQVHLALANIPYRLLTWGETKLNADVPDLTLSVQSGEAMGKPVLLGFRHCYAPDVRNGVPTVQCEIRGGGTLDIGGDIQVRSDLLHIVPGSNQFAYAVAIPVGVYGDSPLLVVK